MACLYVIGRPDGPVKVGVSVQPSERLAALQIGCPFRLELLHTERMRSRDHAIEHEQGFHSVYADHRLIGEWFDLDAELAIEGIKTGLEAEAWFEQKGGG